jgi:LmbE family N-acetylglucosaminyl deacetylase
MTRLSTLLLALLALDARGGCRAGVPALQVRAGAGTVLLVVAPHPDDETLCCGGIMQRVLQQGGRVSIVWLTSGDGSALGALLIEHRPWPDAQRMRAYGMRRMEEARAASARLGVAPEGQLFLGYPDGGLLRVLSTPESHPYRSGFTAADAVPYPQALFPGHRYSGASLERDFGAVLARVQPTLILAPSPLDAHPDHHAAGLLALRAAAALPAGTLRSWIVHGGEGWPSPRTLMPGVPLTPPPRGAGLEFHPFALSIAEEDAKLAALKHYATQLQVMQPFLLAFVRSTELFTGPALGQTPAVQ